MRRHFPDPFLSRREPMAFPSLGEERSRDRQRAMLPCLTIDSERKQPCALRRDVRSNGAGATTMRRASTDRRKWCPFRAPRVFRDDRNAVFRLSPQENTSIKQCDRALGTLGAVVSGFPMRARIHYDLRQRLCAKSIHIFVCAYWRLPSLAPLSPHLLLFTHIFQRVTGERIWGDRRRVGTQAINLGRKASLMPTWQQSGRKRDRILPAPSTGGVAPDRLSVAPAKKLCCQSCQLYGGCHG